LRLAIPVSALLWAIIIALAWVAVANAQVIEGTDAGEVLVGTDSGDKLYGFGGADTLKGKGGADLLSGGDGPDTIECGSGLDSSLGGDGQDTVFCAADDGKVDVISCGRNYDIAFWRVAGTVVSDNCEQSFRITGSQDAREFYRRWVAAYWAQYTEGS